MTQEGVMISESALQALFDPLEALLMANSSAATHKDRLIDDVTTAEAALKFFVPVSLHPFRPIEGAQMSVKRWS